MKGNTLNIRWGTLINPSNRRIAEIANMLSIYAKTPIDIDGTKVESLAGLFVGIHYPENDTRRKQLFSSWGSRIKYQALSLLKATRNKEKLVYWKRKEIPSGSEEHFALMIRALMAKFDQNPEAMKALLSTKGLELTNNEGRTCNNGGIEKYKFEPKIFCEILTRLRDEPNFAKSLLKKYKLLFFLGKTEILQKIPRTVLGINYFNNWVTSAII